jgi:hypothetical protein
VLFLESVARPLLVSHAVAAAVLVASTTHHLVWCRGYLRGEYGRHKGERRFALIAATAFFATFVVGNCLYPTYKVRVRAEYFDNPSAIAEEARLRAEQHKAIGLAPEAPAGVAGGLSPIARLFDIKEHWVALGCAASLLLLLLSRRAHPKDHPRVLVLYLGLSLIACSTAWFGAIIGLLTASYRSVGGVT